jgi:site-specific DNA-cytosine methylase
MKNKTKKSIVYKNVITGAIETNSNPLYTVSFFSGVRGLDIGAKKAGFTPLFLSDVWTEAGRAFELNLPSADYPLQPDYLKSEGVYICGKENGDIANHSFETISKNVQENLNITIKKGEVAVIHGGPPCQDVSRCNVHREVSSKKNRLIFELLRIISDCAPKVGLIEQVPNLLSHEYRHLWMEIELTLNRMTDYVWGFKIMNAVHHGARQSRKRLIIMLVRRNLGVPVSFPTPAAPDLSKVSVNALLPDVYHFSPGQFLDNIKCAKSNVFCTMTSTGSEYLYGIDGKRRQLTVNERLMLSELEGLILEGIPMTSQKTLVGNMVQISLAEALFRHIREHILKVPLEEVI